MEKLGSKVSTPHTSWGAMFLTSEIPLCHQQSERNIFHPPWETRLGSRREGWLSEPSKLILFPQHLEPRMADYITDLGVWRVNLPPHPQLSTFLCELNGWMPVFEEAAWEWSLCQLLFIHLNLITSSRVVFTVSETLMSPLWREPYILVRLCCCDEDNISWWLRNSRDISYSHGGWEVQDQRNSQRGVLRCSLCPS